MRASNRLAGIQRQIERWPAWGLTLLMAGGVLVVAGLLRLVGLAGTPPGFRIAEASNALFAQTVGDGHFPIFFGGDTDAHDPLFIYLIKITGSLSSWGVGGPRAAAALLGLVATVACALWYARALGHWWGFAGGILIATSFWQLMFGRQAVEPIAMAAVSALGLWCLWSAYHQPQERGKVVATLWFLAAGVSFGLGFYTHAAYRFVLPAAVLSGGYLLWNSYQMDRTINPAGPVAGLIAMLLVMAPLVSYYLANPDDYRRGFELAGGLPSDPLRAGWDYLVVLQSFVWEGPGGRITNLPGRALLDPLLAVWAIVGLLTALRHPLNALHAVALLWLIFAALPAAMLSTDDPGLLLATTPVVFLFPLLGMRTALQWARRLTSRIDIVAPATSGATDEGESAITPYPVGRRRHFGFGHRIPAIAVAIVMLSLAGSAFWSLYDYFWVWAPAESTYFAMRGDVRDGTEAAGALPQDGFVVYYSAGDAERIVRYLAQERPGHSFEEHTILPMTATRPSYLVYAASTAPDPELLVYLNGQDTVESGRLASGLLTYEIRFINPRTLDNLPIVAPVIPFENGWELLGFDVMTASDATPEQLNVSAVLVWGVPTNSDSYLSRVRLQPIAGEADTQATASDLLVAPWKESPFDSELILTHQIVPFPETELLIADLESGLVEPVTGALIPVASAAILVQDGGYVVLNRIGLLPASQ